MGLLSKAFERRSVENPDTPLTAAQLADVLTNARKSAAGVAVTEQKALTLSAVWSVVKQVAETVGSLPFPVYRRLQPRGKDKAYEHPLYRVLNLQANPWSTAMTVRQTLAVHALIWGNGYAHIERNGGGDVTALWPLRPGTTRPVTINGQLFYDATLPNGTPKKLPYHEVLHIPGLSLDSLEGVNVISAARESLGVALALQEYAGRFFSNGANPGGVFTTEQEVNRTQRAEIAEAIMEQNGGLQRSGKPLILGKGTKYQPVTVPPVQAEMLGSMKFSVAEVARWFGFPLHKLAELEKGASYASIEQMALEFVEYCLRPWLVQWEQSVTIRCLTLTEQKTFAVEHIVEGLLRGDLKSRKDFYHTMRQDGIMNADEIREKENMNPQPEGQGQIIWMPVNMQPAAQALKGKGAKEGGKQDG